MRATRRAQSVRYRPGPKFRCPDCWDERIRLLSTYRSSRGYPVECTQCDRLWISRHREARRMAEAQERKQDRQGRA